MTGGRSNGVFQHAADRQRAAEQLLRVVVVIAVVEDAAQVLLRLRQPDDLAERHALPDAHAQRAADVQAGHHLGEADRVLLAELQQPREVESGVVLLGQCLPSFAGIVGVGDDLQLPRLARQADFGLLLLGQRVRQRLAARDVAELCRRREEGFQGVDGRDEFRRERLVGE